MVDRCPCPLCKSKQNSVFARVKSFNFDLVYYLCQNCGFVFQDSHESRASDPAFYEKSYRQVYQSNEAPTAKDLRVQQQRAVDQLKRLQRFGEHGIHRILDVGASTGVLLETLGSQFNAQTMGIEPGEVYRQFAQDKGIQMVASVEDLLAAKPERFDLITLMHVLEHLSDPLQMLNVLREELLNHDGWLLIEVPNFYAHDSYELAHLGCYTPHTLTEMIQQAGYKIIQLEKHGFPRSKFLNLYISILAKPKLSSDPISSVHPERLVRFKRQVGMFYRRVVQKIFPKSAWLPVETEVM